MIEASEHFEPPALTLMRVLRHDSSPLVRAEAAGALAALPDDREASVRALIEALDDDHELPRRAAAAGLRRYMDEEVARRLVTLLREEAPELWREIAGALAGRGAELVGPELRQILDEDPKERSRRGAARALRPMPSAGDESFERLVDLDPVLATDEGPHPLY